MSQPDIAEQIAKEICREQRLSENHNAVKMAEIIRQHVAPLVAFTEAAKAYINIRSNHPQEAGGAWRELCAAEEKLKESRA